MKGKFVKAAAFTVLTALLFSMFLTAAWAAPETFTVSVPSGDSSFTIDLSVNGGNAPYAGIEFGMTVSHENALTFASFDSSTTISGAIASPFITKDGVHYFGFFTDENTYSGKYNVGTLSFEGYTGNETVTLTLYMNVFKEDGTTISTGNEAIYVITVRRASSGGNNSRNPIVVDVPDTDTPLTGDDREHYIDVTDPDAWYYDAVYYVTDAGLMNGTGGNQFSPNIPLTRAMFVTILGRLAEQQEEKTTGFSNPFQDVPADQWYTPYVAWAADKDIVLGYSATTFGPNDPVTREQMAALMVRFCDDMDIELGDDINITFSDAGEIGDWAKDDVNRAAAAGLMQGSNGRFRPKATATRAEAAQLFMNFLEGYLK